MAKILLTNDDGYDVESIKILFQVLSEKHDVTMVAPAFQQSGMGKAVTGFVEPLELIRRADRVYSLSGSPADCVQVGIYQVLGEKPDLVVSGINDGSNIGHARNLSSGTVGAALEAALDGVQSIASSVDCGFDTIHGDDEIGSEEMFKNSAAMTLKVVDIWLENHSKVEFEGIELLSLNMPPSVGKSTEIVTAKLYRHPVGPRYDKISDKHVSHVRFPVDAENAPEGTDVYAIKNNQASLVPMNLELVDDDHVIELQKLFM